jgi:hypothetical protein
VTSDRDKLRDGYVVAFVAAGFLVLGTAIFALRLVPARSQARRTLEDEAALARRLEAADERGRELKVLAEGLEKNDPRVVERVLREQGAGKPGEERIVVVDGGGESRPGR